jgi:hypothetical protein
MNTVKEHYEFAIKYNYYSLCLLIDYLVKERKVLKMSDDEDKLKYYLQDRFAKKMNEYLSVYEVKRNEQIRAANNQVSNRHVG